MTEAPRPKSRLTKKRIMREAGAFAPYEEADAYAVQAVANGTANDHQQKRALDWIIREAALAYDNPFRAGGSGQTEFLCGQMFVGNQIIEILKYRPGNPRE